MTWVQILACVIILICPLRSFFLYYPGEALEGPISTGVSKYSTMLIQIMASNYKKNYYAIEIQSTVDIHIKKYC